MIALTEDGPLRAVVLFLRRKHDGGSSSSTLAVLLSVSAGLLLSGYMCFAIGSVLALESTRSLVKILGGYRSEWIHFLEDEIQKGFRIYRSGPGSSPARAKTLYHPLTGRIDGYKVEYAYQYPCYRDEVGNTLDNKKRRERWADVRRVICDDRNSSNDYTGADPSVSLYRKEVVRSLAEYIQRDHYRRRLTRISETDHEDSEESSSDSESSTDGESSTDASEHRNRRPHTSRGNPSREELVEHYVVPFGILNQNTNLEDGSGRIAFGVPYGYWRERRQELLIWAEFVEPKIAFFGMTFYITCCWLQALLTCPSGDDGEELDCYDYVSNATFSSIIAIVLMVPYCILEVRSVQQKKMRFWRDSGDPLSYGRGSAGGGTSEFERIRNAFRYFLCFGQDGFPKDKSIFLAQKRKGPTIHWDVEDDHSCWYYARRESLYAPSFVVGTLMLWLGCGLVVLVLSYVAVYCMVQWMNHTAPIQRKVLERFKCHPGVFSNVSATVTIVTDRDKHGKIEKGPFWRKLFSSNECAVRIQYVVPSLPGSISKAGSDAITEDSTPKAVVFKEIQSDLLYQQCLANPTSSMVISMHIDPSYPLSGYPTAKLERDILNSWSFSKWQLGSFISLWLYLMSAAFALDVFADDDNDENPFEVDARGPVNLCVNAILIFSGFALLLPGASVLRQIEHDSFLLNNLYESTKIATHK